MMAQVENAFVTVIEEEGVVRLCLGGRWSWSRDVPVFATVVADLEASSLPVRVDSTDLKEADATLLGFLLAAHEWAGSSGRELHWKGLPPQTHRLLELALEVPRRDDTFQSVPPVGRLESIGRKVSRFGESVLEVARFTGACTDAFFRLIVGHAHMRRSDFFLVMQRVSIDALPIVALISFLVGLIISFLGAVTLREFGAEFAVAYLVGYGMLREMGAIMTGIIMSGRTGAAFAAEIGSMKVNDELDALQTSGISPIDYLVLPRILALVLVMPFLTAFANVVGILGGWIVAEGLMGVPGKVFFAELNFAVGIGDLFLGLFKGTVFGVLIAMSGCLRGLQCGTGASAVGVAATRAVVTAITLIIISTAVIDWAAATLGV